VKVYYILLCLKIYGPKLVYKCCLGFPVFEKILLVSVECSSQTVAKIQLNELRLLSKLPTCYRQFFCQRVWVALTWGFFRMYFVYLTFVDLNKVVFSYLLLTYVVFTNLTLVRV
jgi:hypothetical protein